MIETSMYPTVINEELHLSNFSLTTMAKKLNEECVEVVEAVAFYQVERIIAKGTKNEYLKDIIDDLMQELLDVNQMSLNMLYRLKKQQDLSSVDIKKAVLKHNLKLEQRGWECDYSLKMGMEIMEGEENV